MKVIILLIKIFQEFFLGLKLKRKLKFVSFIFILLPFQAFLEVYSIALLASVFTNQKIKFLIMPMLFNEQIYNSVLVLFFISIFLYLFRMKNLSMLHVISSELTFYWQNYILNNMSKYGREESFLDILNSKNNYLSINKDLNNLLQNELLSLYRDVFFPFLKIISNAFILVSIIIYCIYQSGIIFLPFLFLLFFYYLFFYSIKNSETIAYSNEFIQSQSRNNDIIRYIFSNVNSFVYSFTDKIVLDKSIYQFQRIINNYFKLSSTLLVVLFQIELLFVLLIVVIITIGFLNNNLINISSILIVLLGLQKTLRTAQQISNSYTLFKNNSKSINNLFKLLSKIKSLIKNAEIAKSKNFLTLTFDKNKTSLNFKIKLDFLNKANSKNKKNNLNLLFNSDRPTHIIAKSGYGKTLILKKMLEEGVEIEKNNIIQLDAESDNKKNLILKDIAFYLPQSPQMPPINISDFIEPSQLKELYKLMRLFDFSENIINKLKNSLKDKNNKMNLLDNLSLSGGEIQRLWLIKAILSKPLVLILDEPFSALDSNILRKISKLIPELLPQNNILIVTSHVGLPQDYIKIFLDK